MSSPAVLPALRTWPLVLGLLGPAQAFPQDPFAPGLRWTRAADPARPWIPKGVALGADGNLAFVACGGANQRLEVLSAHASGTASPLVADTSVATSSGSLAVAAGSGIDALFSAAQFPQPDAQHRRTIAERRDATGALAWSHDPGFTTNGPARIACDQAGSSATLAVWDSAAGQVQVDRLEGASGALRWSARVQGAALNALAVCADGSRAAIAAGLDLWVFDAAGAVLHHSTLTSSTQALALSGDGRRLAVGDFGRVRLLSDQGLGYAPLFTPLAPPSELATRAALSSDGGTLAIGWWSWASGTSLRFEAWDVASAVRVVHVAQTGPAGGLQNLPEAVAITPDGRRIAFACWGDGTSAPEVLLYDRAGAAPLLSVDLPGSALGLSLDASGTRVVVATKTVHQNQFGSAGEVRLYDTGERDLTVLVPPMGGGTLALAARYPGATVGLFLFGTRSPLPIHVAGATGDLLLERNRLRVLARPCDANGRADLTLPLPNHPGLVGTQVHVQAAFRVTGALHFGSTLVDPLIL